MVNHISRYIENPGIAHWKAAIPVLRYLWTTHEFGGKYDGGSGGIRLVAFCDADWASNSDDWRSVYGVLHQIAGGAVLYKSKTQTSVALSSPKAE